MHAMCAGMAGEFARRIGAKHLVLTHISSRYGDFLPTMDRMVGEAMRAAGHERVYLAEDGFTFALEPHTSVFNDPAAPPRSPTPATPARPTPPTV
jgi:hypothetical protein